MIVLMTNEEMGRFLDQYGYRVDVTEDPVKRFRVSQKSTGDRIGTFSQFELEILCQGVYIAWSHMTTHLAGLRPPEK